MKIGISTRYQHHEATYAAIRLANLAKQLGHDVEIDCVHAQPSKVCRVWDRHVKATVVDFAEWAKQLDVLIWTHTPPKDEVAVLAQLPRYVNSVVLPMWQEINDKGDRKLLSHANHIVCPHLAAYTAIHRWGIQHVRHVPWDCGLPLTVKHGLREPGRLQVLVAIFDQAPAYLDVGFIDELAKALQSCSCLHLTVAYSSSQMQPSSARRLQGLCRCYRSRVQLARGISLSSRPLLYSLHDLTLWPAAEEDIGMTGLYSLAMGTPVLAPNVPPVDEYLHRECAVLAPCHVSTNKLGIASGDVSSAALGVELRHLADNPDIVVRLQRGTIRDLVLRRQEFLRFWTGVFCDEA